MIARAAFWLIVLALSALAARSASPSVRGALPVLLPALVAALFANSLRDGHRPLIARAIAAIDGPALLADAAVARYARRLTWLWAFYLAALAMIVAVLVVLKLPAAARSGALGVPVAALALLLGEFFLRRRLLPQAPRHSLFGFLRAIVVAWPALLADRDSAAAPATPDAVSVQIHIAASHPALAGHFPDDPIVPGVVLLEYAASAAERAWRKRVAAFPQAKFLHALRPEQAAQVTLQRDGARVQWRIVRGDTAIASGVMELSA